MRDIDLVLGIAKDIALSNTSVGSGKAEDAHTAPLEVYIDAEALYRAVHEGGAYIDARYGIGESV